MKGQSTQCEALIDWKQYVGGEDRLDELREFVLDVVHNVRMLPSWEHYYESWEVGGRVDVAIGNKGGFFVNEMTPFWFANFFSMQSLESPHTQLCHLYAEAFDSWLHTRERE